MLPLCCLCPCCLCSGFQPVVPLWLRAHTLDLSQRFPGKNMGSSATQCNKEMRRKILLGPSAFLPILPIPPAFCLLNCWKWSATSWVILKKFLSSCNNKDGHLGPLPFVFYEREMKISVLSKLELWLEKTFKKYYRSAMSLHKSDKNVA